VGKREGGLLFSGGKRKNLLEDAWEKAIVWMRGSGNPIKGRPLERPNGRACREIRAATIQGFRSPQGGQKLGGEERSRLDGGGEVWPAWESHYCKRTFLLEVEEVEGFRPLEGECEDAILGKPPLDCLRPWGGVLV